MHILKILGKCIGAILVLFMILWDILEFIAIPAFFVIIGIFNELPASYYWITVGGYLAIFALFQLLLWRLEQKLDKHFDALLTNKIAKIAKRFSN